MDELEVGAPERADNFESIAALEAHITSNSIDGLYEGASVEGIKKFWDIKIHPEKDNEEEEYPYKDAKLQEKPMTIEEELKAIFIAERQIETDTTSRAREDGEEWTLTIPTSLHSSLLVLIPAEIKNPPEERHSLFEDE